MPDPWALVFLGLIGIFAGGIAGLVGFGSAVLLLPICNAIFGPVASVGILTVAALMGNLSRVALWYREVQWSVVWRYWLGGVPFAIIGSVTLVQIHADLLPAGFGAFILLLIPVRRWMDAQHRTMSLNRFPVLGAVMGFLSAMVSTTGPVTAPFFLSYGLTRGAYLSTEALSAAGVHLAKTIAYGKLSALDLQGLLAGIALGGCLLLGAAISKPLVLRLNQARFILIVEILLAVSGLLMIAQAFGALG